MIGDLHFLVRFVSTVRVVGISCIVDGRKAGGKKPRAE